MDTLDGVKLELEAERYTHRKDNEYLSAELGRLLRGIRKIGEYLNEKEPRIGDASFTVEALLAGTAFEQLVPERCEGCGINYADPPSKLCPGCQAYRDHQY